ncbi:MAG: hypothetical protein ICV83_14270 [Cytophagales bacterium]|nr:hypothetical protein [Cytophagales bacterium]
MQLTQTYAQPSSVAATTDGMQFRFSAERSRPPVQLDALVGNSLGYARLMLALRQVVVSNLSNTIRDHSAYQAWVQERYLEELPAPLRNRKANRERLVEQRALLKAERQNIAALLQPLQSDIRKARSRYRQWVWQHDREKAFLFDPVISVHPDAVIFECFSGDESSYGRVTVPAGLLQTFGETRYGTTNIDFSLNLANEIHRVRSYRPAWLKVAFEGVELSTAAGAVLEKKIDLPPSWVRGFLQAQSAAVMDGVSLALHARTVSRLVAQLERRRERESPRSVRFQLRPGEPPVLVVDPWNLTFRDTVPYEGSFEGEIRIWGRRRLLVLKDLLPYTDRVHVKLLGTGMPSYWSVTLDGHRFDLGLSGWTTNDWARKGNFDLIAAAGRAGATDLRQAEAFLVGHLAGTPAQLASTLGILPAAATAALQELCRQGRAMHDHLTGTYRWRQLLQQELDLSDGEADERQRYALSLVQEQRVATQSSATRDDGLREYQFEVRGKSVYKTVIRLDGDGRVRFAECTCRFHRRNKLRQGPCPHLMASVLQCAG